MREVEKYFETPHKVNVKQLAKTHNFEIYKVDSEAALREILPVFYGPSQRPAVLIVETPGEINGEILKKYFEALK